MPPTDAAATWDEHAATWDHNREAHIYADQAFASLQPFVEAHLGAWKDLRVLDFGAGTGLLTARLAPRCREVVALDISPKMIEVLATKISREAWTHVHAIAGTIDELAHTRAEFAAPFDLVVASSVCSFLPDFPSTLLHLRSALRPGGLFVQWDWHVDAASEEGSGFSRDDLRTAYAKAGLQAMSADVGFIFAFQGQEMEVIQGVGLRR